MPKKILITGGAGFIGINAAAKMLQDGHKVVIFDNLSRKGGQDNLEWLKQFGGYEFIKGDVADYAAIKDAVIKNKDIAGLLHLAGQVAVTTSITNPRQDFESNLLGTFNVLESVRAANIKPVVIYASTNKVYGGMENVAVVEGKKRYSYKDYPEGVPETMPLDFHSPYGCSKGGGDQYMHDYGRIYGIPTVVFRQSCIYGPRQFGIEDQGWIAWFIIAAVLGKLTSIYGNGKQVRDVLYIDDLIRAYKLAIDNPEKAGGKVFNVGGGSQNSISIWEEFSPILEDLLGKKINVTKKDWRQGDQPIYVSDIRHINRELGWKPVIKPAEGIATLYKWVIENRETIEAALNS